MQRTRLNANTLFIHSVWTPAPRGVETYEHLPVEVLRQSVWTSPPLAVGTRFNRDFAQRYPSDWHFCIQFAFKISISAIFASESTILAVSEVQRIFLYLSDTNTDHLDIDVCDVLVLTVCEHLPSQVLIQCINTTFRQVFNTKWSQRRGVDSGSQKLQGKCENCCYFTPQ